MSPNITSKGILVGSYISVQRASSRVFHRQRSNTDWVHVINKELRERWSLSQDFHILTRAPENKTTKTRKPQYPSEVLLFALDFILASVMILQVNKGSHESSSLLCATVMK